MTGFNPDEYVDVAERVKQFYDRYPDGRLTTVDFFPEDVHGLPCESVQDAGRSATGHCVAWEPVPGPTQFTRDSELMNAQTAAIGRAIVMLGFDTKKLASTEEVRARQNGDPHGLQASRADAVQPSQFIVNFGKKHKGKKVEDVPREYWEWCFNEGAKLPDDLRAAVELHLGLTPVPAGADGLDDIPF